MTVYTQISKKIGWDGRASIPTMTEAERLLELVKQEDESAFEAVFRIHRFAANAGSNDDVEAMNLIYTAFITGSNIWNKQQAK